MRKTAESEAVEAKPRFPWGRAFLMLALLWASVWVSGVVGGRVGVYLYETRWMPEAPYSEREMENLERVAPTSFQIASQEMKAWESHVEVETSLARVEGGVAAGLVLIGVWGVFGVAWLWNRERDRQARLLLNASAFS
jgi:hypothetical protein